ncbi:MAG: S-layer homology domain-containing protein [Phascolarctobacterium sp.]|nr:S-layer homology domain-containing protein [Phascolarctobacterium sp.]
MKKSLVLAMAMALGVTASAYAANPFSDVPAGHWAYDSVAKLAAAGVVDGYADGAFDGDKLMTRYEMAQIVAKAMAKGADCDKLAAEFADELDTLGVRVAKLEKGADAVKITGQIRASYQDKKGRDLAKFRTRLFVKGQINDDWSYTGRLHQEDEINNNAADDSIKLNWAFVEGPIGGVKATLGRQNFAINSKTILDCEFDGAKLVYGKDVKVTGFYGRTANANSLGQKTVTNEETGIKTTTTDRKYDFYAVDVNTKVAGIPVYATYYDSDFENKEVWNLGLTLPVAKDLVLKADYMYGDSDMADVDDNGYVATLAYKGAKASAPGSYGVWATYYDQPANCYFKPTLNTQSGYAETWDDANYGGYEGFEIGANYALAKNIVAAVRYFDIESQKEVAGKICSDEVLWTEVVFTF